MMITFCVVTKQADSIDPCVVSVVSGLVLVRRYIFRRIWRYISKILKITLHSAFHVDILFCMSYIINTCSVYLVLPS